MALRLYDTKELVPEAHREAAIETKDGKFAVEEIDPALGAAGKKALDEERVARQKADDARKAAEKERDDLKRAADARAGNISDEQLQKLRDEDAAKRKAELDPVAAERDAFKAKYRKATLNDRVQALFLKNGGMPDRVEDAMLALDKRTDLTDTDGIVVKDRDGKVTTETIDDFLKKTFKSEKPWLYAGSGAAGSGARGSSGSADDQKPEPSIEAQAERQRQIAGAF